MRSRAGFPNMRFFGTAKSRAVRACAVLLGAVCCAAASASASPTPGATFDVFTREDGRTTNTRAAVQRLMEDRVPALAFDPNFTPAEFSEWKNAVRKKMAELAAFPSPEKQPAPKLLREEKRDGYALQKWECYPLPGCAVPFLVLVPDGVSASRPAPAALCFPGSGQTKELSAGEPPLAPAFALPASENRNDAARQFARAGFVAVAADNPCAGEASDLERFSRTPRGYDYDDASRFLLELGWSYQGYAAFVGKCISDWLKTRPDVRADRVVVSGFSLGTETLMILGVLDPSLFGFVYNDFLCRTRERALAMSVPAGDGRRHYPNSIRHLIPGMLTQFDFPDLVAALAPRPVILTEGGADRDFRLVEKAYALAGAPENARCMHQPKYADPSRRKCAEALPRGIGRDAFFAFANVDPRNHYFKGETAIPWIKAFVDAPAASSAAE